MALNAAVKVCYIKECGLTVSGSDLGLFNTFQGRGGRGHDNSCGIRGRHDNSRAEPSQKVMKMKERLAKSGSSKTKGNQLSEHDIERDGEYSYFS